MIQAIFRNEYDHIRDVLFMLLEEYYDVDDAILPTNQPGVFVTPVSAACGLGKYEILRWFLHEGCDPSTRSIAAVLDFLPRTRHELRNVAQCLAYLITRNVQAHGLHSLRAMLQAKLPTLDKDYIAQIIDASELTVAVKLDLTRMLFPEPMSGHKRGRS